MYRGVIDIVKQAGQYLDSVLIPKVGVPSDIYVVDCLISFNIPPPIGTEASIETALSMSNVEAIAKTSPRLEALHCGVVDFAAGCRA